MGYLHDSTGCSRARHARGACNSSADLGNEVSEELNDPGIRNSDIDRKILLSSPVSWILPSSVPLAGSLIP